MSKTMSRLIAGAAVVVGTSAAFFGLPGSATAAPAAGCDTWYPSTRSAAAACPIGTWRVVVACVENSGNQYLSYGPWTQLGMGPSIAYCAEGSYADEIYVERL